MSQRVWSLEHGSASVMAVSIVTFAVMLSLVVLSLGEQVVMRSRAQSAADMAALAGAGTLVGYALGDPCEVADEAAARFGGQRVECAVSGIEVTYTARVTRGVLSASAKAQATLRSP